MATATPGFLGGGNPGWSGYAGFFRRIPEADAFVTFVPQHPLPNSGAYAPSQATTTGCGPWPSPRMGPPSPAGVVTTPSSCYWGQVKGRGYLPTPLS